jgi:sugar porter (SP) family MFS transporter
MLVYRSAIIAALGGLLFGFDVAVISGAVEPLREVFSLCNWWLGLTVASALIGTILGAALAQIPANRFGRKPTLMAVAILFLVSAIGCAVPWNLDNAALSNVDWILFMFFRLLGGVAVGVASVVCPLYTAEISPARSRGFLVAFVQFNIVFGILLAFFTNYLIGNFMADSITNLHGADGMEWRWMLGIIAIPSILFFLLVFTISESPRWLIVKGQSEKARAVIQKLGTDEGRSVDEELDAVRTVIEEEAKHGKVALFTRRLWFPITLVICIAAFNQLSGINAVLYYAPSVFSMAGAGPGLSLFLPVIIGLTNLIFTMLAMAVIDSFGRKKLMLIGSIGYITSLAVVAITFMVYASDFRVSTANFDVQAAQQRVEHRQQVYTERPTEFNREGLQDALVDYAMTTYAAIETQARAAGENIAERTDAELSAQREAFAALGIDALREEIVAKAADIDLTPTIPMTGLMIILIGLMAFIASHAFGQGAVIWVFLSEIFPQEVRAQGAALGSFTHWVFAAIVTQLFPVMLGLIGPANIFFMFAGFMVFQLLWVLCLMPETKQVPLEEMKKRLGIKD